jgi:GcrA cell cycle regulator
LPEAGIAKRRFADGKLTEARRFNEIWNRSMITHQLTWTSARVELLKRRFEEGLTCREIAASIGVSRNAVIGKLSRLGLTRGPADAETRATTAKPRAAKSSPRQQYQMLQVVYENGEPVGDAPIESARPCSLFELSEERCRWPISTPGAEDFCFCGNMPLAGVPYCAGHTRLAYRSGARAARA